MPRSRARPAAPRRHLLHRRAAQLLAAEPDIDHNRPPPELSDDDLFTTAELAEWFQVSTQWLEIGRAPPKGRKPYGPPFVKLGPRCIRYRRGDVRQYLRELAAEYAAWLKQKAGATGQKIAPDEPPAGATVQSKLAALDPDQVQGAELTAAERATLEAILRKVLGGAADGSASRQNRNRGARQ